MAHFFTAPTPFRSEAHRCRKCRRDRARLLHWVRRRGEWGGWARGCLRPPSQCDRWLSSTHQRAGRYGNCLAASHPPAQCSQRHGARQPPHLQDWCRHCRHGERRSEEHTSELQSLMRISYAVFCLKKNKSITRNEESRSIQITLHT